MISSACLSEDRKYRYTLYREWDKNKPSILFIMLNPSTADEIKNDDTIDYVIDYSKSWGYGSVYVGNLYAHLDKDDKKDDPENILHVRALVGLVDKVIYAWGVHGKEPQWLSDIVKTPYCLSINSNGTPRQPLRARKELQPILYRS
jgi:hypothetical protein